MRTLLCLLLLSLGACDEARHSNFYPDLGWPFKHTGDPCRPDIAPGSECGYPPQFYCSPRGVCASACNTDADCRDGALCGTEGSGDMLLRECRPPTGTPDLATAADLADGGRD